MDFYSAKLLFYALVEYTRPRRKVMQDESVVVFRAKDREHAFLRAIEIGRSREHNYLGGTERRVRWVFVEVMTLDWVGPRVDGSEVASELGWHTATAGIPFDTQFHPEQSNPRETF